MKKKNGKGKEHGDGYKSFEGEYLDGMKWKGKFVKSIIQNFHQILIEGEFSNGEFWNWKGKEYNDNRELVFEREYFKGKRWNGKGKEYKWDHEFKLELIFEGEYLKGKRWNGKGKEYKDYLTLVFDGEYLNGEKILKY